MAESDKIDLIVNASFEEDATLVATRNMNAVAIFTSNKGAILNSNNRYAIYTSASAVSNDFGTASVEATWANVLFSQDKTPVEAGGYLVLAYWRAGSETVEATSATLKGAQISEASTVSALSAITDGSMVVTVDGVAVNLTGLDFTSSDTLSEIVDVLQTAFDTDADVTLVNNRIYVKSTITGVLSLITLASAYTSGSYVGEILGLQNGATLTQGAASVVLSAETKVEAIQSSQDSGFAGLCFIDTPTDVEKEAIATFTKANKILSYDSFSDASTAFVFNPATNEAWDLVQKGYDNYRMMFKLDGDRKILPAYMGRTHTMQFNGDRTAFTMNLKGLSGIGADALSDTQIADSLKIGFDVYISFRGVPKLRTSGRNKFTDYTYILYAYEDFLKVALFNYLSNTPTKLPQTNEGMAQLVQVVEDTNRQFQRNGWISTGGVNWNRSDFFGNRDTFLNAISQQGFYTLAMDINTLTPTERTERKGSVIMNAIKLSGAVHQIDIITKINI